LCREQEYTAIVVGGMSFRRMLLPLAVFASITLCMAAWVQEYLGPKAQMVYYAKKLSLQNKSDAEVRELHLRLNDFNSRRRVAMTAESLDTKSRTLTGLSIVVSEDGQKLYETWAQRALWMPEIKHWRLLNGYTQMRGKDGLWRTVNFAESEVSREAGLRGYGSEIVFESEPNTVELVSTDKPDYLTYGAIRERIQWMVDHDYSMREINRVRVYVSRRWTMATSCLLFVLVGAPLAVRPERGAMYKMGGVLALAIALILAYYICWNATSFLGEGSRYPWAWAWSSNVAALCFGLYLCAHVRD
ncbi:MAG: LptF/LptG family permease, partial [Armatimonadetes bacterium]|nr:LptF/LptG family permease [Armatimonadota bacterium]